MKNFVKKLVLVFIFVNLGLTIQMAATFANDPKPPPAKPNIATPLEYLKVIGEQTGLPNYVDTGVHPDAAFEIKPGVAAATSPIYFALDMFRYVVSSIAFIVIIISSIRLVTTASDEEATKAKSGLLIGIIGLLIIQLADVAIKKIFFGELGEAFEDVATVKLFAEEGTNQLRGIIGFVEAFLGAGAVFVIILKGFTLVTSGGEEEEITKAKKHIIYAIIGLAIVALSEVVVRGFVFPEQGSKLPNIDVGKKLIVDIANYVSGFIAIFAFATLFYGGYRYVVSGGEDEVKEKVKKTILGAVMALILALAAFAIVNTLVKFEVDEPPAPTEGAPP